MPYFIGGVTADYRDLIARTPGQFRKKNRVEVLTRHRVTSIDPENRRVRVVDLDGGGESWSAYTKLLIATGASAFVPPVPGTGLTGVFTLRKLEHSIAIKEFLRSARPGRAVVVGAGPIGVEMCEAFRGAGLEVTAVEMADRVMPLMDADLSSAVQAHLESMGVTCVTGVRVEALTGDGSGMARAVATTAGELPADMVLLAIGIRPVTDIAAEAGVEPGAMGAIRVDGRLRTNLPDVFAAGDCATTTNLVTGRETWIPLGSTARKQGRLAADNMFGADLEFPGVQGTSVVKAFDLTVGRTGLSEAEALEAGFSPGVVDVEAEALHSYYGQGGRIRLKVVADRDTGRLLGAQVIGDMASAAEKRLDVLAVAVRAGLTADDLQYLDLAYAPPYSTAVDATIVAGNLLAAKILGKPCSCTVEGLEL